MLLSHPNAMRYGRVGPVLPIGLLNHNLSFFLLYFIGRYLTFEPQLAVPELPQLAVPSTNEVYVGCANRPIHPGANATRYE